MARKALTLLVVFTMLQGFLLGFTSTVYAVEGGDQCGKRTLLGVIPAWDKYLDHTDVEGRCTPVLKGMESALPIGIAIIETFIRLAGFVAVVMIIIGSFKFITSQGNSDAAAAARKTVINSLIGLVIVIISTTAVSFIGNSLIDSAADTSLNVITNRS